MTATLFVRVAVPWLSPSEAEIPPDWRGRWPSKWCGVRWDEGRLIGVPVWAWAWLRRTQGDYLERCFVRDTFRGRTYLRGVACPPGDAAPIPRADRPRRAVLAEALPDGSKVVRRCGCGRNRQATDTESIA